MSFEDSVNNALEKVRGKFPKASISASINGKIVTLRGEAPDMDTKGKVMAEFNSLVDTENTINQILVAKPAPAAAPAAPAAPPPVAPPSAAPAAAPAATAGKTRIHEVVKGDTLSAIAKHYYGKASDYPRIFEANRDILDNPDKIKVGQKLKIPE